MHCKRNRLRSLSLGLVLCIGLLCYPGLAQAATLNVPGTYDTIQTAINAASSGDIVLVDDGIYNENIDFKGMAITVKSVNGAANTIIDGKASGSVVTFENGEGSGSLLDGFTLTNGSATNGGGIYCLNSSPTITNCTISGNSASLGLGGGGILCFDNSSPTITNCTIDSNSAHQGGGIACYWYSSPTITNCTISGNSATGTYRGGGGIYCYWHSLPTITNCTIDNNSAYRGGGIYCNRSSPTITNCTISDNSATGTYDIVGGGIECLSDSSPTVVNSIFWGDTAKGSPNEIYLSVSSSIDITYSNITPYYVTGAGTPSLSDNIDADPQFVGGGDYHLTKGSPCIDRGTSAGAPADDIDGDARPYDVPSIPNNPSAYDMGADEYTVLSMYNISLTSEWNLISLPLQPTNTAIESVLTSISGKYASVWAFMNGNWKVYDPANPDFSDLLTMEAGWGYWIKMTESANLSISGSTPSDTIPLMSGWNLVGYNSTESQDIADALASIDGKYVSVWAFIDGGWKVYDPANPDFSDLLTMEPNYGYWINTTQACSWNLP